MSLRFYVELLKVKNETRRRLEINAVIPYEELEEIYKKMGKGKPGPAWTSLFPTNMELDSVSYPNPEVPESEKYLFGGYGAGTVITWGDTVGVCHV